MVGRVVRQVTLAVSRPLLHTLGARNTGCRPSPKGNQINLLTIPRHSRLSPAVPQQSPGPNAPRHVARAFKLQLA